MPSNRGAELVPEGSSMVEEEKILQRGLGKEVSRLR